MRSVRSHLVLALLALVACAGGRRSVLVPGDEDEDEVEVMDFSKPFPFEPMPPGWSHRKFWTRAPMTMSLSQKEGVAAIRLETRGTASMLVRYVDIDIDAYPRLAWRWYVETPIASPLDERTREGDDHPARLYLAFRTARGKRRAMEVIWGNRLRAGDYKTIGGFPHYVANGGDENVGAWHAEEIDLSRVYGEIWPDGEPAHLTEIALFCDSDETRSHTVSYFADVRMRRR
jgi:hypothetical protein